MEIDFKFLKNSPTFSDLYPEANKIHKLYTIADYRDVISNSRRLLEAIVKKIFQLENLNQYYFLPNGEHHNLRNDTHYLRTNLDYPVSIMNLFDEVRRMGNEAIHDSQIEPDKKQAWHCLCDLHDIVVFLINSYDQKSLYYLRPDIAIQAEDFPLRKKAAPKPQIKLNDHRQKTTLQHEKRMPKKTIHFSSSTAKEKIAVPQPAVKKKTFWQKIKQFFYLNKS